MLLENIKFLLNNNQFDFYYLDEVNSTMSEIKKYTSKRNIFLMAEKQIMGIGRRGSNWISPKGNVYISILLRNILDVKNHFLNTAYTSNIICDVVQMTCNTNTEIKWPNDVLINNKKICGIISEIYSENENVLINTGVGINIASSPKVQDYITTHVNEYNIKINNYIFIHKLMQAYLENLDLLKNHSSHILEKYKKRVKFLGRNVKLKLDNGIIKEGIFQNINNDGSIILKINSKTENIYNARIIK